MAEQRLAGLPLIHARAEGGDAARGLELIQGAVSAPVEELAHLLVRRRLAAVRPHVDIVDQEDVDGRDPEPLEARVVAAHHAVVGVVEHHLLLGRVDEEPLRRLVHGAIDQEPADLGGEHDGLAAETLDGGAEALLRTAESVVGRGIEEADAAGVSRAQRRLRVLLRNLAVEIAERRAAEAEPGHVEGAGRAPAQICRIGCVHRRILLPLSLLLSKCLAPMPCHPMVWTKSTRWNGRA